jgi:hypothetical protein
MMVCSKQILQSGANSNKKHNLFKQLTMEKTSKNVLKNLAIGSAIIWAATIIGCALILGETFTQICFLLYSAVAVHLIIISALSGVQSKKKTEETR